MATGHNERSSSRPLAAPVPAPSSASNNNASYPPDPSPPRAVHPAYTQSIPVPAETDPLAFGTSPQQGGDGFAAHDFAGHGRGHQSAYGGVHDHDDGCDYFPDEPYTAIPLGEPSSFVSPHGQAGSLDMSEDGGDLSRSIPRTSLSTHNSRTQLRSGVAGGAYLPTGVDGDPEKHLDSRPVHAGPNVTMAPLPDTGDERQSRRAERQYGSGEKGGNGGGSAPGSGYNTPRSRSQERSRGGGLGNWAGPGQNNSPYGRLGDSNQASGYTSAASSNPNLQFADGDFIPTNGNWFSRAFFAVLNSHYIVRWIIYIVPVLALLWIPGIVQFTAKPDAKVWSVPLKWWSCWLTVVWVGWWAAALSARMAPAVLTRTLGIVAPELRHYIAYLKAVRFYVGLAGWALAMWISFLPLVNGRAVRGSDGTVPSQSTLSLITQGLFGIFLNLVILLVEKLIVQIIAHNFHKRSYEDRIVEQKFQISSLIALYLNSRDIGRSDTLDGAMGRPRNKRQTSDPTLLIKKALKGAQKAAQTATTVIGTVASEIAGERVLQPNSPPSMVTSALQSANKTKQLARRIYYSFAPKYRDGMVLADISRCFRSREEAERAFAIFDRDSNGDATLEEVEMACLDIHRERQALARSMRDIDSAVGRLDNILMTVWYIVALLIEAGLLNASFNTMIASAGTFILGLSWLIGTTMQEILASIIFLFIKHPYDVGDRISIDAVDYIVLEMHLLSSIFKKVDGTVTQAPHSLLNTKFLLNYRRSGPIWESYTWDVDFGTPLEKIEALRARMLEFLEQERRDFIPAIDISIVDFASQGKLTLSAPINYKSNFQNGALKTQRRNKWIVSLKTALAELEIYGPAGAGDPAPAAADPVLYTQVPWDEVKAKAAEAAKAADKTHEDAREHDPAFKRASGFAEGFISQREVEDEEAGKGNGALRSRAGGAPPAS
ncbi:hypothetical protein JCM3775_000591 [Rhodotorula graminis]